MGVEQLLLQLWPVRDGDRICIEQLLAGALEITGRRWVGDVDRLADQRPHRGPRAAGALLEPGIALLVQEDLSAASQGISGNGV